MDRYDRTTLEGFIYKFGLTGVLKEMSSICNEYAVKSAYYETTTMNAKGWAKDANILDVTIIELGQDHIATHRQFGISGQQSGCAPNYEADYED